MAPEDWWRRQKPFDSHLIVGAVGPGVVLKANLIVELFFIVMDVNLVFSPPPDDITKKGAYPASYLLW